MVAKRHYRKHPDRIRAIDEGRTYFMPSAPCKNGHIALTRVDNYRCSKCSGELAIEKSQDGILTRKDAKVRGLKRYFSGRPCKNGHIAERWTNSGSCAECTLERSRSRDRKDYLESYFSCPENKEMDRKRKKAWQERYYKTPEGKAKSTMRSFMWRMTRERVGKRTEDALGYSKDEFVAHIESKFEDGMSWSNHGEWHIDHIRPISDFLASGIFDPKVVNALDNLQPMWAKDNLSKGASIEHGENG